MIPYFFSPKYKVCVTYDNIMDPVNQLLITDIALRERILKGLYQPILTNQSGKICFFQSNWYKTFDWLEYSPATNRAFCFKSRIFKGNDLNSGQIDFTFVKVRFCNWYKGNKYFFLKH